MTRIVRKKALIFLSYPKRHRRSVPADLKFERKARERGQGRTGGREIPSFVNRGPRRGSRSSSRDRPIRASPLSAPNSGRIPSSGESLRRSPRRGQVLRLRGERRQPGTPVNPVPALLHCRPVRATRETPTTAIAESSERSLLPLPATL